jgi:DNA repair protein RadC
MSDASKDESYDRPRERLARTGVSVLGNRELLALVLGHGGAGRTALDLAAAILKDLGGVHGLAKASPDRLSRLAGMGPAQSSRVLAAIELGRRTLLVAPNARLPLREPEEFAAFLLPMFGAHSTERFGAVLLDARQRLMRVHIVSEGSLDSALAIPRDVFREATISQAASMVVFHNHPSGDVLPSRDDFEVTARLIDAGKIVGIDVLDHLILGDTMYCSMRRIQRQLWHA